jgi:hypothetical protein
MFTDRLEGYRFDETHLALALPTRNVRGWDVTLSAGVLRTGRGLLGEKTQNSVHRAIGNEEVHLPYIDSTSFYPTLEASAERELIALRRLSFAARGTLYSAPDFRSWGRLEVAADQALGRGFSLRYGAGLRADLAESALVEEHIDELSPTAHLGVSYGALEIRWSLNDYGTDSSHLTVGFQPRLRSRGSTD